MAINGIELAIGQTWMTRGGSEVTIKHYAEDEEGSWRCSNGRAVNDDGIYWPSGARSAVDLVELVSIPVPEAVSRYTDTGPDAVKQPVDQGAGDTHEALTFHVLPTAPAAGVGDVHSAAKVTNPKDAIGNVKLPLHLWPSEATALGSLGMLEGECKYGRNNFIAGDGVIASIYIDAAKRHLDAWFSGEECAPDTGTPHLANALASIAIVVKARAHERLIDDRDFAPNPGYRKLVDEITPHVARIKALFADKSPRHFTIADAPEQVA